MAMFVNKPEEKWTREKIAARVNEILTKYIDFDDMAKNGDTPFEDQKIYLDSLDLIEISMYLENAFQIELDLTQEKEFASGTYTPRQFTARQFTDFIYNKLNPTPTTQQQPVVAKPKPEHTTDTDIAILLRNAHDESVQKDIKHTYGVDIPLKELRAVKSFTDYQEVIRRAINNQYSK